MEIILKPTPLVHKAMIPSDYTQVIEFNLNSEFSSTIDLTNKSFELIEGMYVGNIIIGFESSNLSVNGLSYELQTTIKIDDRFVNNYRFIKFYINPNIRVTSSDDLPVGGNRPTLNPLKTNIFFKLDIQKNNSSSISTPSINIGSVTSGGISGALLSIDNVFLYDTVKNTISIIENEILIN